MRLFYATFFFCSLLRAMEPNTVSIEMALLDCQKTSLKIPFSIIKRAHVIDYCDIETREVFTQHTFRDGMQDCQKQGHTYVLAVIKASMSDGSEICHLCDGRKLLRYYGTVPYARDPLSNVRVRADGVHYYALEDDELKSVASHRDFINQNNRGAALRGILEQETIITIDEDGNTVLDNVTPHQTQCAKMGKCVLVSSVVSGAILCVVGTPSAIIATTFALLFR